MLSGIEVVMLSWPTCGWMIEQVGDEYMELAKSCAFRVLHVPLIYWVDFANDNSHSLSRKDWKRCKDEKGFSFSGMLPHLVGNGIIIDKIMTG